MNVIIEHEASANMEPVAAVACRLMHNGLDMVTLRLMRGRNKPLELIITQDDVNRSGGFDRILGRIYDKLNPSGKGKMQISYEPGPDADPVQVARLREHLSTIG